MVIIFYRKIKKKTWKKTNNYQIKWNNDKNNSLKKIISKKQKKQDIKQTGTSSFH